MAIIGRKKDINMTQGNITRLLLMFALPLILGNLFQQLYNMVDTWVVGRFVGDEAFSAVGTVGPLLNIFIYAFQGFANGAGVVTAQYFGAGDLKKVHKTVHTMFTVTLISCVVFTVVGLLILPAMIDMMKTPDNVYDAQMSYLQIIFCFISFQIIYNTSSAILQAVGNSTVPFAALVSACITNIVLDLLFVIKFNMGVEGVAWATIISQGISCLICLYVLFTKESAVKITIRGLCMDKDIAKQIVRVGLPTSIQSVVTSFSNVFMQSYINVFGSAVMGGWTCYSKVDTIIMLPMQTMGMAVQTFVGQNIGAGDEKRARAGYKKAIFICFIIEIVLMGIIIPFAGPISSIFTESEEIIKYGVFFLRTITPFMGLCCVNLITASALRGAGNSNVPMIIMLSSFVAFRQVYMFIASRIWPNTLLSITLAYPFGWILCAVLMMIYYLRCGFGSNTSIADKSAR